MKTIKYLSSLIILTLISINLPIFAQMELGINYANGDPQGLMSKYIQQSHGVSIDFLTRLGEASRFSLGVSLGVSVYGQEEEQQEYTFTDGSSIDANLTTTNSLYTTALLGRFELLPQAKILNPYIQAQAGANFFSTNFSIMDPREEYTSDCPKPIESEVLSSDVTFSAGLGVGTRLNLTNLFGGSSNGQYLYLNLHLQYLVGGNVDYMSVNPPSGNLPTGNETNPIVLNFASEAQPDVIQSYESGYVYNSSFEMLEFKIGIGYMWGRFFR